MAEGADPTGWCFCAEHPCARVVVIRTLLCVRNPCGVWGGPRPTRGKKVFIRPRRKESGKSWKGERLAYATGIHTHSSTECCWLHAAVSSTVLLLHHGNFFLEGGREVGGVRSWTASQNIQHWAGLTTLLLRDSPRQTKPQALPCCTPPVLFVVFEKVDWDGKGRVPFFFFF